jgi:hypothetical protein
MSFDDGIGRINVVASGGYQDFAKTIHLDAQFVGKDQLDAPGFTLAQNGIEKGKQKGIEHHTPHHLAVNGNLDLRTLRFKKGIGSTGQTV